MAADPLVFPRPFLRVIQLRPTYSGVRLVALCRPDSGVESAPDPESAVWQFRHGRGDVLALPEGGSRERVFEALRTILLNVLFREANVETLTAEQMQTLIDRADANKLKKAAEWLRQGSKWAGA